MREYEEPGAPAHTGVGKKVMDPEKHPRFLSYKVLGDSAGGKTTRTEGGTRARSDLHSARAGLLGSAESQSAS